MGSDERKCNAPSHPNFNSDNGDFNGYLDELRVVNGVALWTEAFTPPSVPWEAEPGALTLISASPGSATNWGTVELRLVGVGLDDGASGDGHEVDGAGRGGAAGESAVAGAPGTGGPSEAGAGRAAGGDGETPTAGAAGTADTNHGTPTAGGEEAGSAATAGAAGSSSDDGGKGDDEGCGCRVPASPRRGSLAAPGLGVLLALGAVWRRRRKTVPKSA